MAAVIRDERPGDEAAVRSVVAAAFAAQPVVPDLVDGLRADPARASLVAVSGDAVVGHVMLSRSWVDAPSRLVEVLVLSPLSVAPPYQRQGIGSQLVRASIAWATEAGWPLLFLEGDPAYYGRFGFVAAGGIGFTRPSVRIPEPGFQVVPLPARESWMTGALVYCDAFWAFDCVGLR